MRVRHDSHDENTATPVKVRYADPPYLGLAHYYKDERDYRGEVDHRELIASLTAGGPGWALSASERSLRVLLPLCPEGVRVGAWVKPIGVPSTTYGPHSTWEAVIYMPARRLRPGFRDWLRAMPARLGGSSLLGRKPLAFCAWMFRLLGMLPGDDLVDLFPGSGNVSRAWEELSRRSSATRRPVQVANASRGPATRVGPREATERRTA